MTSAAGQALILGHPLWHSREGLATDQQLDAKHGLAAGVTYRFTDIRDLANRPNEYILSLMGTGG